MMIVIYRNIKPIVLGVKTTLCEMKGCIKQECFRCWMRRSLLTDQSKLANHGHGKAKGI
jgi:hypothetical protein